MIQGIHVQTVRRTGCPHVDVVMNRNVNVLLAAAGKRMLDGAAGRTLLAAAGKRMLDAAAGRTQGWMGLRPERFSLDKPLGCATCPVLGMLRVASHCELVDWLFTIVTAP